MGRRPIPRKFFELVYVWSFMGRCPKPRKFFEKNLTKNFHTGKVFG